jgi:hypothetical protein
MMLKFSLKQKIFLGLRPLSRVIKIEKVRKSLSSELTSVFSWHWRMERWLRFEAA